MQKIAWTTHLFFAAFSLVSFIQAAPSDYVKITAKAAKDTVRAGKEVKIVFQMQPQEGFHVNIVPAISLELTDAKNFTLSTKKFVPDSSIKTLTTKEGYKIFDPHHIQPVAFAVKIAKGAKPGRYPLKTKLTYYYCSDAEGWCSFASEEFVINLVVVK